MIAPCAKRAGLLALILTAALTGQPAFEVASIKPIDLNAAMHTSGLSIYPGGRLVIPTTTLKGMIVTAFGISWWQLSGGEPWMEKDQYDLEAKPPANLAPAITNLHHGLFNIDDERLRMMLQALLVERFHLQFHLETKIGKVYRLEAKGNTQTLRPTNDELIGESTAESRPTASSIGFAGARWNMSNTSMPQLAKWAADVIVRAPVTDQTGRAGYFNHRQTTNLLESEVDYSDPSGPFMIFLQEMGLKLEADRGPVETFVIDSAEKPSPN